MNKDLFWIYLGVTSVFLLLVTTLLLIVNELLGGVL